MHQEVSSLAIFFLMFIYFRLKFTLKSKLFIEEFVKTKHRNMSTKKCAVTVDLYTEKRD